MRLITCLGTGRYEETTYTWTDPQGVEHAHTSVFSPVAAAHALGVSEVAVLATDEARAKHGEALERALAGVAPLVWQQIPRGANEDEMWAIYAALGNCVAPGDEIALDVTHGFRSLPMVLLLAAAFLRVARQAQVRHILYGAYEASDQSVSPSRTPVFDLAPMFALLEWANAADRFARQGDARDLAELLRRDRPPYHVQQADPQARNLARRIGTLAKSLDEVSGNLLLSRPHRAMAAAVKLRERLSLAQPLPTGAQPFAELLGKVSEAFAWLALPEPTRADNLWENLARQRQLIHWYAERGHWVHACTLAREWLVSWRLLQQGGRDLLERKLREAAEESLGSLHDSDKRGHSVPVSVSGAPPGVNLGRLWGKVTSARNQLAHVVDYPDQGKGASAVPTALISEIQWCIDQIDKFALDDTE